MQLLALVTPPPLLELLPVWDYGDTRPIGSHWPDELTMDYRQALIDARARFLTRHFPDVPDVANLDSIPRCDQCHSRSIRCLSLIHI